MSRRAPHIAVLPWIALLALAVRAESVLPLFSCAADNDLYRVLSENGVHCARFDSPAAAIDAAPENAGLLLLADGYPGNTQRIEPGIFKIAAQKNLRLYVEYPAALPGLEVGAPRDTQWERGVVVSDAFGPALGPMRIVGIHDCHFVPVVAANPHIAIARVAGFDTAVYGLPTKDAWPILFEHPGGRLLVATTKLSQFITARYGPADAWEPVCRMILRWTEPTMALPALKWTPVVRPSYAPKEALPPDAEREAIRRGSEWVLRARMLIHPSWRNKNMGVVSKQGGFVPERNFATNADLRFDLPPGDGKDGLLEGFQSKIRYDGSQSVRWNLRTDCTGEHVAPFALAARILKRPQYEEIGRNLADFVLFKFDATSPWRQPDHPAFGLLGWACPPAMENPVDQTGSFYGVISARICLSVLAAAGFMGEGRWDDRVLQVMLANFRTTGPSGLRPTTLSPKNLESKGWRYYFDLQRPNLSAHPTAQLLAANLATYQSTRYRPLLERTKSGLRLLMETYPTKWKWWNGLQQERARLILPLAWLVRVEDTPEHREWLERITGDFLKNQVACGAVREELGEPGQGQYPAPVSNEAYGTAETPLIQANGDPACDLLYTLNSGFVGLHEAAAATGNTAWREAEDRLATFLCRTQIRSERRPELDGAWFRAFDFGRWDYWASNADAGWGAWCVETGWIQGWLVTTFALRELKTTLWDLACGRPLAAYLDRNLKQLLPDDAGAPTGSKENE